MITSFPAGALSDRWGRKGLVYSSTLILVLVYVFLVINSQVWLLYLVGILFGMGFGMFFSVDFALAIDSLPDPSSSAKEMGLWGVAIQLGILVGLYTSGPLLESVGGTGTEGQYTREGYISVFAFGGLAFVLSCVFIFFIRLPKKSKRVYSLLEDKEDQD